ncbi:hypothetical protein GDO86_018323 [Hymenochirus boettgeri]|uniref:Uncharacterized protein n=1 Tax=Hymenochirus boettgeri TaxID=247094 RepID=A0A8T2IEN9_9PIPI|nr:hypothetical protein GDO86_018323 [Hymenochirus boettgeri]
MATMAPMLPKQPFIRKVGDFTYLPFLTAHPSPPPPRLVEIGRVIRDAGRNAVNCLAPSGKNGLICHIVQNPTCDINKLVHCVGVNMDYKTSVYTIYTSIICLGERLMFMIIDECVLDNIFHG